MNVSGMFQPAVFINVLLIVRTCRTAIVCAPDYDDGTQFYIHVRTKKSEHG